MAVYPTSELPQQEDLRLDIKEIMVTFANIAKFYGDLPFSEHTKVGMRYFYENPAFSYGDAIALFGIMRTFGPRRIVEIGSGYSSCLIMDTNDLFFDRKINLLFIDPYPELLQKLLGTDDDFYRAQIRKEALQDVSIELFLELRKGDILFIDSSHVSKLGSDVNDYLFRILPALEPGVVIHIHDIPYPFEYPPDWVLRENRSWNEAYILRAFLQYNYKFKIIYFNHFVYRHFEDQVKIHIPLCLRNCGASLWLQKMY